MIPSRRAFESAVNLNQQLGHENLGFVSASFGFLPVQPPLLHLPDYYREWDAIAADLPDLFRRLKVRKTLDAIPKLEVDETFLPDEYLLRASSLISILVHSYVRSEASLFNEVPRNLMNAWEVISKRLDRPAPILSYIDLILYNWKLRDPYLPNPMRVENLDLLFPTVGNEEERIFYLTQTEIAAASAPLMLAVIQSQEAASLENYSALEHELLRMVNILRYISEVAVHKINPNPYGRTYVDQVVWAKMVAPFAVPFIPGRSGPSGTAAPLFFYIDAFLGRQSYASVLGHETANLLAGSPSHWRSLVEAVGKISVRDLISRSGSSTLKGLFNTLLEAYAGDKGYLGTHRLKAYGFLEIAFKSGRSLTIGGFKGLFRDKTWNQIDNELGNSRNERYLGFPKYHHTLHLKSGVISKPASKNWITSIKLDGQGDVIYYRPGDRIELLPENSPELIDLTLKSLHANGTESIKINREWQSHLQQRPGFSSHITHLPIRDILRFGQIRPLTREAAKILHTLTASNVLMRILNERLEDQWEMWDVLQLLEQNGFDTRRLWKAEPWEAEYITRLIKPERPRLYSIASAPSEEGNLEISVAGLEYDSIESDATHVLLRKGVATEYLRRLVEQTDTHQKMAVRLSPSARFHLPPQNTQPIVMFAGGSGIAPFAGFLHERRRHPETINRLYLSVRTEEEIHHRELLEQLTGQGQLDLRVSITRENKQVDVKDGKIYVRPGTSAHINDLIDKDAELLWKLISSRDVSEESACLYICGRTGFAVSVLSSLKKVIRKYAFSDAEADEVFRKMIADHSIMLDVFTTYSGASTQAKNIYDISDVVMHNNASAGYWMVLNGKVFDLSDFIHLHAGGRRILANNAGIDATRAYQSVQHHINSEIDALLGMYEIGRMRRLDFGTQWGVGLGPQGLFYFTLEEAFVTWVRYLYLITEMENAISNDFDFMEYSITRAEEPGEFTPLKAHLMAEAHKRFVQTFLDGVLGEDLDTLWSVTTGMCDDQMDVRWMKNSILELIESSNSLVARSHILDTWVNAWRISTDETKELGHKQAIRDLSLLLSRENQRVFIDLKLCVRQGVQAFEKYEFQILEDGGDELLQVLRRVPELVSAYYQRVSSGIKQLSQKYQLPMPSDNRSFGTVLQSLGHGAQVDFNALKLETDD
ncbi:MAG: hypothetical protein RL275_3082 [Chloroflexota bacterium]